MEEKKDRNLEITTKYLSGITQYELAKEYNLHPTRVYGIIKNTRAKYPDLIVKKQ